MAGTSIGMTSANSLTERQPLTPGESPQIVSEDLDFSQTLHPKSRRWSTTRISENTPYGRTCALGCKRTQVK